MAHAMEAAAAIVGTAAPAETNAMSDDTLVALISQRMSASHQWYGAGKMSRQRIDADKYYRGEPLGNEQEGRSQVVSRDVAEAVDSIMPSLMRIFASGDDVVIMEPSRPDAEDVAKQATDYLNWTFLQQNEGFRVLYMWFKDALLKRNGIVMAYYETRISRKRTSYEGLTEGQWNALQSDGAVEILRADSYPDPSSPSQPMIDFYTGQPIIDPQTGQIAMQPQPMLYNCTIMAALPVKRLVVQNVPPDEFIIERRAVSLEDANFMARRRLVAASDLIELGYDPEVVRLIPKGNSLEFTVERKERFASEESQPLGSEGDDLDPSMRKAWITEAYIRTDYDGDGIAEWRKVTLAGDTGTAGSIILGNEEIEDHPFASLTPIPDPHRFYGYSIFDQTEDIQDIKTALIRGALDSIYLANSPRVGVVDGQANMDDILDSRVGGVVRLKNPNAIVPIPTVMAAPQAFQMIEYIDTVREQRTGVPRMNPGLDPDTLNKTATGAQIVQDGAQQRIEMIARIFAETGMKRLFRRMFTLTCLHEDKAKTVRLRGKWVDVNPREWENRMDVSVSVGSGLGNKGQQMQQVMAMLNLDERIVQLQGGIGGPLLTAKNVYNKLVKLCEAAGWKTPDPYYQDPDNAPPPPPKPNPEIEKMQADAATKIQIARETNAAQAQGDMIRIQSEAERDYAIAKLEAETKIQVALIAAQSSAQSAAVAKIDGENLQKDLSQ